MKSKRKTQKLKTTIKEVRIKKDEWWQNSILMMMAKTNLKGTTK